MAEQAAQTITPGTANKTIAANRYLTGTQTILGDKNLIAANIIRGKTIFGVKGTAVYAGDIKGYFLEPPKEYESLTGGWEVNNTLVPTKLTFPSSDVFRLSAAKTDYDRNDLYWSYFLTANNKIVNKYRYVYLDYKNLNLSVSGSIEYFELDFSYGFSNSVKKFTGNVSNQSGTLKLDVSNTQGESTPIRLSIRFATNSSYSRTMSYSMDITAVRYDEIG